MNFMIFMHPGLVGLEHNWAIQTHKKVGILRMKQPWPTEISIFIIFFVFHELFRFVPDTTQPATFNGMLIEY